MKNRRQSTLFLLATLSALMLPAQSAAAPTPPSSSAPALQEAEEQQSPQVSPGEGGGDEESEAGWGDEDEAGWGEEEGSADEGSDPFAEMAEIADQLPPPPPPPSPLRVDGFFRSQQALWARRSGVDSFAKARQSLDLSLRYKREAFRLTLEGHGEYDLAYQVDRDRFDDEQIEAYELRFLNGRQFLAYQAGQLELSAGRQIITWGEGDGLSPLDVVNPRDQREPGAADVDDLRLAVLMSRLRWSAGAHDVDFFVVHESYFGEFVPPLADYSPFSAFIEGGGNPLIANFLEGRSARFDHAQGRFSADQQSLFLRWSYRIPAVDLGLYGASLLDQQGVVLFESAGLLQLPPGAPLTLTLDHKRYQLAGVSAATSFGPWLLKSEVAYRRDRAVNTGEPPSASGLPAPLGVERADDLQLMAGLSYNGITDWTFALEGQHGVPIDAPEGLLIPLELTSISARVQATLLRERLRLSAVGVMIRGGGEDRGGLARFEVSYDLSDPVAASLAYVYYHDGAAFGPFYGFTDHDRLMASLRWDFTLY